MKVIKETTLHPEGNDGVDLYPKTNINQVENLNEEINSLENSILLNTNNKLDKPAMPAAESAVTMLADGTVGTKLLSEIGGGGGKLYMHEVKLKWTTGLPNEYSTVYLTLTIYSSINTPYTKEYIYSHKSLFERRGGNASITNKQNGNVYSGYAYIDYIFENGNGMSITGVVSSNANDTLHAGLVGFVDPTSVDDTVTEV